MSLKFIVKSPMDAGRRARPEQKLINCDFSAEVIKSKASQNCLICLYANKHKNRM